jgi:hypothetical protein
LPTREAPGSRIRISSSIIRSVATPLGFPHAARGPNMRARGATPAQTYVDMDGVRSPGYRNIYRYRVNGCDHDTATRNALARSRWRCAASGVARFILSATGGPTHHAKIPWISVASWGASSQRWVARALIGG